MITDLHLQKFLEGRLSVDESEAVREMLKKSPELQERLDALEGRSQIVGRSRWARLFLDRKDTRRKSKWTYLPIVILILFIFSLAGHWFSRPGDNSTFTYQAGNASAVELLYDGEQHWRYLDLRYSPTDSLTFSIRDKGRYYVGVYALYNRDGNPEVIPVFSGVEPFARSGNMPKFMLQDHDGNPASTAPDHFLVAYHADFLPRVQPEIIPFLWSQGASPGFHFQIFSLSQSQ